MVTCSGNAGSDYIPTLTARIQTPPRRSEGQRAQELSLCAKKVPGLQVKLERPGRGYVALDITPLPSFPHSEVLPPAVPTVWG